jgi:hypothetical protein
MLPWCQRHAAPLISDVGQESDHSGVIRSQGIPLQGVSEAPIDHLGQGNDLSDLLLELGIGLRVCVGRIGMTLVAGNFIFPKGGGAVEKLIALLGEFPIKQIPVLHIPPSIF